MQVTFKQVLIGTSLIVFSTVLSHLIFAVDDKCHCWYFPLITFYTVGSLLTEYILEVGFTID